MYVDASKTYVGIVENNIDPQKLGRCKVRVIDIFDELPTEDIPWASPWKDLNGNSFNLPDKGKVVTVIFDSGNIYKPEYIYADHYNSNLEEKLKSLSEKNYASMKAILFDDKVQIFSNDEDGLVMDYKWNNINITDSNIDVSLKDNFGKVNIGDADADQSAVLGTNFFKWFDQFITVLASSPYHGNLSFPVFASSQMVEVCQKYKLLREAHFLSNNVFLNSNFKVNSVLNNKMKRQNQAVAGDPYTSTTDFSTSTQTSVESAPDPVEIRPSSSSTYPSTETYKLDPQGAQDFPNYGKLVVSSSKTSPTIICYGGITVNGRESGDYMWDYFGSLKNKFQIFVAKNPKVDGLKSYETVIQFLQTGGYNTSEQILYLFSGGYLPAMSILNKYKDKFKKIILVDIWMGNKDVGQYYIKLTKENKDKVYYIYTSFGANNKSACSDIAQNAGYKKLKDGGSMTDHMNCNKLAIDILVPGEAVTTTNAIATGGNFQTGGSTIITPKTEISSGSVNILPTIGAVQNSNILAKQHFGNGYGTSIQDFNGLTSAQIIANMNSFITDVLEPFAIFLKSKYPELYKSWYITSTTRAYIPKGGSTTSQHMRGEAIDSQIVGATARSPQKNIDLLNAMLEWYKANPVGYGQILFETRGNSCWIHWSYRRGQNKIQLLRFSEDSTKNALANTTGKYVVGPLTASDLGFA